MGALAPALRACRSAARAFALTVLLQSLPLLAGSGAGEARASERVVRKRRGCASPVRPGFLACCPAGFGFTRCRIARPCFRPPVQIRGPCGPGRFRKGRPRAPACTGAPAVGQGHTIPAPALSGGLAAAQPGRPDLGPDGERLPHHPVSRAPTTRHDLASVRGWGDLKAVRIGGDKSLSAPRWCPDARNPSLTLQGEGVGPQGRRVGLSNHRRRCARCPPPTGFAGSPSPRCAGEGWCRLRTSWCAASLSWICKGGFADANAAQILPPPHAGEVVRWVGQPISPWLGGWAGTEPISPACGRESRSGRSPRTPRSGDLGDETFGPAREGADCETEAAATPCQEGWERIGASANNRRPR